VVDKRFGKQLTILLELECSTHNFCLPLLGGEDTRDLIAFMKVIST